MPFSADGKAASNQTVLEARRRGSDVVDVIDLLVTAVLHPGSAPRSSRPSPPATPRWRVVRASTRESTQPGEWYERSGLTQSSYGRIFRSPGGVGTRLLAVRHRSSRGRTAGFETRMIRPPNRGITALQRGHDMCSAEETTHCVA